MIKKELHYELLGLNIKFNGRILPSLNYYYTDKNYKNKEVKKELIALGKEKAEELEEQNIWYINKGTKSKFIYFGRCPETFFFKGNKELLSRDNYLLFMKFDVYDSIEEANKEINRLSKMHTLLFKKEELKEGIIIPEGSIIFIKSDFLNEVSKIKEDDPNLYVSASLKVDDESKYNISYNLALFLQQADVRSNNLNEFLINRNDIHYKPSEAEEIKETNRNYTYKTGDRSKDYLWQKAFLTNVKK